MWEEKRGGVASEEAEQERARSRRRLREEQDAEFQAALREDQVIRMLIILIVWFDDEYAN